MTTKNMPNLDDLDADRLLETLAERDPSFAEGSAIYDVVSGLSSALRLMREAAGLTQTELAKRLDLTQGRISQIESGLPDHAPSLEMVARFAVACGFTPTVNFGLGLAAGKLVTPDKARATSRMPGIQIGFAPAAAPARAVEVESGSSS
jgi:transcriptional regulator with XRE-family HTH domain